MGVHTKLRWGGRVEDGEWETERGEFKEGRSELERGNSLETPNVWVLSSFHPKVWKQPPPPQCFGFCPLFTLTVLSRRAGSDVDATAAAHWTRKPRHYHVSTRQVLLQLHFCRRDLRRSECRLQKKTTIWIPRLWPLWLDARAGEGLLGFGVGGGGIFVPMLNLVVGFDTKSAAALSKCSFCSYSVILSVKFNLGANYRRWEFCRHDHGGVCVFCVV